MRQVTITLALVAIPRAARACPVCFGQSDSPMAWGTNVAILFMLGVTGAVLAGFGAFIVYLMRRAKLAPDVETSGDRYILRTVGPVLHASEPQFLVNEAKGRKS
jgi:hypothetical protein